MTLAQRLGELATANEQGLLECVVFFHFFSQWTLGLTGTCCSDDEYRLLRANLFERFTNVSTVPSEAPIVRLSVPAHQSSSSFFCPPPVCDIVTNTRLVTDSHIPSPSPHVSRPASVHSKVSIVSTFSGLLRRATSRRFNSSPGSRPPTSSDSMILPSTSSPVQNRTFPRYFLRREASDSSLGSEISAHRTSEYQRGGTPTSRKSARNPPSSYSNRGFKSAQHTPVRDQKHRSSGEFDLNGEHTQSVKELRAEIEAVEAEGRRLLDAFNGLELSTLTKQQRRPVPMQMATETNEGSIRSGRSASLRGPRQMNLNSQPLVSQPITLSRKNSLSSMSSRGRSISGSHHPPLPTGSSNSLGRYGTSTGSTPSVNNAGFPTLETVKEASDPALAALESEMADIRRRRAEVVARYEAKLELLRAKLKGAEMHEKLLKR